MSPRLGLSADLSMGWVLLGVLAAILFSFWAYRHTVPPVRKRWRLLLAVLRAAALIAVWLLLADLRIDWRYTEPRKTELAVLVDGSGSMAVSDGGDSRWKRARNLLSGLEFSGFQDSLSVRTSSFSDQLHPEESVLESDRPPGGMTDPSSALISLARGGMNPPDAVLMISDGIFNRGGPPLSAARGLRAPFFTVLVGDSSPVRDIAVERILAPPSAYAGDSVQVSVRLQWGVLQQKQLRVTLRGERGLETRRVLELESESTRGAELDFTIVPRQAGLRSYEVVVDSLPGEVDVENNARSFAVEVLPRRRRIALLAARPGPDVAALARALEGDGNTEALVVVGAGGPEPVRGRWEWIGERKLDGAVVMLAPGWPANGVRALRELVVAEKPLLLITGSGPVDADAREALGARLGEVRTMPARKDVLVRPVRVHPLVTGRGGWRSGVDAPPLDLPPLTLSGEVIGGAGEGERSRPVITVSGGPPRTLRIAAGGLGDWARLARLREAGGDEFAAMLDRWFRWLLADPAAERISLEVQERVVTRGLPAELGLTVLDESMQPVTGAEVEMSVSGPDGRSERIPVTERSRGGYTARFRPWTEGRFKVSAVLQREGERVERSAELVADSFDPEMALTRARPSALRELARVTGGRFLLPGELERLAALLPRPSGAEEIRGSWRPFGAAVTLLIVTALLTAEWLIRTRKGMV